MGYVSAKCIPQLPTAEHERYLSLAPGFFKCAETNEKFLQNTVTDDQTHENGYDPTTDNSFIHMTQESTPEVNERYR